MKYFVYCIRDKKLQAYDCPVIRKDDKEHVLPLTIRGLMKTSDPVEIAKYKDSSLYYFGEFDDLTGKFDLLDAPEKLVDYEDYLVGKDS